MDEVNVRTLTVAEYSDILDCLDQHAHETNNKEFHSIMVLFPDVANKLFNSQTPANGFCIKVKFISNFHNPQVLQHAIRLWEAGLVGIEVCRDEGASFYAIPKSALFSKNVDQMIYCENRIPFLDEFDEGHYTLLQKIK